MTLQYYIVPKTCWMKNKKNIMTCVQEARKWQIKLFPKSFLIMKSSNSYHVFKKPLIDLTAT